MIELRSVTKTYPRGPVAVDNLSMEIFSGDLCVLVGPSGCGKTTTLKMINRLIEPSSGEILIDDVNVLGLDVATLRRGIGYVMQQGGLFPHLRVSENIATVPRLLGWSKERIASRVEELLTLVGLDPKTYLRRYPHELSGGERQRVGVARALGGDPPVLLMDEPFGAVDPIARRRLQEEFRELQQKLEKTVVFVTHDIDEALLLGDRLAIMQRGGVLEQYDTPTAILARPSTTFVAEFVGVDRDLQRLAVTPISREEIDTYPSISASASVDKLRQLIAASPPGRVVTVDDAQLPIGVIDVADLDGRVDVETAGALAQPIEARLSVDSSLKLALITMLHGEDGVIAITDHDHYLGLLSVQGLHNLMRQSAESRGES